MDSTILFSTYFIKQAIGKPTLQLPSHKTITANSNPLVTCSREGDQAESIMGFGTCERLAVGRKALTLAQPSEPLGWCTSDVKCH